VRSHNLTEWEIIKVANDNLIERHKTDINSIGKLDFVQYDEIIKKFVGTAMIWDNKKLCKKLVTLSLNGTVEIGEIKQ
jgi:hypothetical protein